MTKEYYQAHKAEIRAKQKAYENTPEGRAKRLAIQERYDKSEKAKAKRIRYWTSEKGKATMKRHDDKRRATEEGKNKMMAHRAVWYAVYKGRLTRMPCEVCGGIDTFGHHHKGYDKDNWLNVQWLCHKHHLEAHGRI